MPVTPATLTPSLIGSLTGVAIQGPSVPQLAGAIGTAFPSFLATIPVTTNHVGVLGVGTGTGKVAIEPASGIAILTGTLAANGIVGPSAPQMASGIITALAQEINTTAIVQVGIIGTSVGAGVGTLSGGVGATFTQILTASFGGAGIVGPKANSLANAIGEGVANWLSFAIINTVDTGTPSPPFNNSTGVGIGKVF